VGYHFGCVVEPNFILFYLNPAVALFSYFNYLDPDSDSALTLYSDLGPGFRSGLFMKNTVNLILPQGKILIRSRN
jgi:hypothetical protein